ncbi:MAG: phosphatidylserine decarboxylase family protein [Bacteroidaceae bacterium]|nr:phosphatidylserine decarboxylase family protein [Bacteroidaceae bacterium]
MVKRIRKIKNIRLHSEGTHTLVLTGAAFVGACLLVSWAFGFKSIPFWIVVALCGTTYLVIVNFFRCPVRLFPEETTEGVVVAPADGKVVVVEEVDENEYFHDRRLMVSIFMSVFNVHANWIPADGTVKLVRHHAGRFMAAWLPKSSTDNERSTVVIQTPEGQELLVRQVAGAVARRIVTYPAEGEDCYIDEHMGFIKFGSRVDVYLPLGTQPLVRIGQATTGNETVIARLTNKS